MPEATPPADGSLSVEGLQSQPVNCPGSHPSKVCKVWKEGEAQVLFHHDILQLWHTSHSVAHFVVPVVDKETGWLRHLRHLTHAAASLADP